MDDDISYLLLTPGPLTTSRTVREAMLQDNSTWDVDYNRVVQSIRRQLVQLASRSEDYSAVLMQGSGTFGIEATLGSVVPADGKMLIISNGAYGRRMVEIASRLRIRFTELPFAETEPPNLKRIDETLAADAEFTHVALVHCETTTGILNPAREVGEVVAAHNRCYILDCMSSFGGISMAAEEMYADYLISSANKCIQGVPGFSFVVARRRKLEQTQGRARSLSLDLYDQWREMEQNHGKWRYTSPTHAVAAFAQALKELREEGGVAARYRRYCENHRRLVEGMRQLGFRTLLRDSLQSPIITAFCNPDDVNFAFDQFYDRLKARGFVIYPGKVTAADTFRIGTIGHVFPDDISALIDAVAKVLETMQVRVAG